MQRAESPTHVLYLKAISTEPAVEYQFYLLPVTLRWPQVLVTVIIASCLRLLAESYNIWGTRKVPMIMRPELAYHV